MAKMNKSFEPSSYWEACKDKHLVDVKVSEMKALSRNNTWLKRKMGQKMANI